MTDYFLLDLDIYIILFVSWASIDRFFEASGAILRSESASMFLNLGVQIASYFSIIGTVFNWVFGTAFACLTEKRQDVSLSEVGDLRYTCLPAHLLISSRFWTSRLDTCGVRHSSL